MRENSTSLYIMNINPSRVSEKLHKKFKIEMVKTGQSIQGWGVRKVKEVVNEK